MNNRTEEIKNKIEELFINSAGENLEEEILKEIKELTNPAERNELFNLYIKKTKESCIENEEFFELPKEEVEKIITILREDLKNNGGLTDSEIDTLFSNNDFNIETLYNQEENLEEENNMEEELVIEEERELEEENNMEEESVIEEEKELEEENSMEEEHIIEEEREIVKINNRIAELTAMIQEEKEKAKAEEKNNEKNTVEEMEKTIEFLESQLDDPELDAQERQEILNQIAKLQEEKEKAKAEEKNNEKNIVEEIEKTIEFLESQLDDPELDVQERQEILNQIAKLQEEKAKAEEKNNEKNRIEKLEKTIEFLESQLDDPELDAQERQEILNQIAKLQEELNSLKPQKDIGALEAELQTLKEVRDAYNKILVEAIDEIGKHNTDDEDLLNAMIHDFIKQHDSVKDLDKYENVEKLKKELHEDIFNNLKEKRITKKEQNTKLLYKALAGVAGFAAGLAASAVPGVGTIRMGIAAAKLASTGIRCWTKKHPDGKIAKIKDKFNEKCPKITNAVNTMREKIKSDPLKWAINGFAAGYITGNLIEMITGETIWEHIKGDPDVDDKVVITGDQDPPIEEIIEEPIINPSEIEIKIGDVLDVSDLDSITVSSYTDTPAAGLMKNVGKNVIVEKFNEVNGVIKVHLAQPNGLGYGWTKLSDIQNLEAKKMVEAAMKTGSKSL